MTPVKHPMAPAALQSSSTSQTATSTPRSARNASVRGQPAGIRTLRRPRVTKLRAKPATASASSGMSSDRITRLPQDIAKAFGGSTLPQDSRLPVQDTKAPHQVHRPRREPDRHAGDAKASQHSRQLLDPALVGSKALGYQYQVGTQPESVGSFKGCLPVHGVQDRHAHFGQPGGSPAFLAGPDRRCRPAEYRPLRGHHEEVSHIHLVRVCRTRRKSVVHLDACRPECRSQAAMLPAGPCRIGNIEQLPVVR